LEVFAPNLAGFGHQLRPDFSFWIFRASSRENLTDNRIYWDLLNLISLAKLFPANSHNSGKMENLFDIAPLVLKNVNREAEEDVFARGADLRPVCRDRVLSIEPCEMSPA